MDCRIPQNCAGPIGVALPSFAFGLEDASLCSHRREVVVVEDDNLSCHRADKTISSPSLTGSGLD